MMRANPGIETVAVTGAGGFIGSHLTERLLREGYAVRAMTHYNALGSIGHLAEVIERADAAGDPWRAEGRLTIFPGDVLDPRLAAELVQGCACVFHLAALIGIPYSYRAPESYLRVNAGGTMSMLEACRAAGVGRLVVTSTSEVYGTARETPITERHLLQAQSPYAASKIAADKMAEAYHLSFGLPVVTLRPFNTYGPRQSARAIVPVILSQLLAPERAQVELGALDPVRDLTYVEDTVAGFLAVARAPIEKVAGRLFNVGTGQGRTIKEIAELAMEATGIKKPIASRAERMRPEKSEVGRLIAGAGRLREATGWAPAVDLRAGLARAAEWFRARPDACRPGEYQL